MLMSSDLPIPVSAGELDFWRGGGFCFVLLWVFCYCCFGDVGVFLVVFFQNFCETGSHYVALAVLEPTL